MKLCTGLFPALLLSLAWTIPARAAITASNIAHAVAYSATSITVTFSGAVTSGDALVLLVGGQTIGSISSVPTESLSETVNTAVTFGGGNGTSGTYQGAYYVLNTAGASANTLSFTVSKPASNAVVFLAAELHNSAGANTIAFDQATAIALGTTASTATASLTPSGSGEYAMSLLSLSAQYNGTITWGSSFTQEDTYYTLQDITASWADFQATASALSASATLGAAQKWAQSLLLFKSTGGSVCTHEGRLSNGTIAVPTASSTVVWRKDGTFGTVDCAATQYWQPKNGAVFGVN